MCDDDKFGSLEVDILCVMLIRLEVCKFTKLYVMMISLKAWKLGS